jgi:hypothetical protein
MGGRPPAERQEMELPTAGAPADRKVIVDEEAARLAIYSYDMANRLAADAIVEYAHHMASPTYFDRGSTYRSHVDTAKAMAVIATADRDYLKAALLPANDPGREKLLADAAQRYQDAIGAYQLLILKFYVTDEVAAATFGEGINRANIESKPRATQDEVMQKVRAWLGRNPPIGTEDDIAEYERSIARAMTRLGLLMRK